MRIFLTGATGCIGAAVLDSLLRAGHDVTALVRHKEKARIGPNEGAIKIVGELGQPESFRAALDGQDGYVHAAYDSRSGCGPAIERSALELILAAARRPRTTGSTAPPRFVIYTPAIWIVGPVSDPPTEETPINPIPHVSWRPEQEQLVLEANGSALRTVVVRPGLLYGGGAGMICDLFSSASNGLVRVVGDGNNRWPLVYDRDLADLYARLVAREDAAGIYHANDEGDERVNDLVDAIKPHLAVRPDVRYVPIEEARHKMGAYADALALDQVVRSPRARALGWAPSLHSVAGNAARLLDEWRASRN
jgi:nucleoside-diphosphate-sugar epimerase